MVSSGESQEESLETPAPHQLCQVTPIVLVFEAFVPLLMESLATYPVFYTPCMQMALQKNQKAIITWCVCGKDFQERGPGPNIRCMGKSGCFP